MPTAISSRTLVVAMQSAALPQIVDVRRQPTFDASERMITNAVWRNPESIADWITALDTSQSVIVYCVHGHEVSQSCAERLEKAGFRASYLEGGFAQWIDEGHPTILKP